MQTWAARRLQQQWPVPGALKRKAALLHVPSWGRPVRSMTQRMQMWLADSPAADAHKSRGCHAGAGHIWFSQLCSRVGTRALPPPLPPPPPTHTHRHSRTRTHPGFLQLPPDLLIPPGCLAQLRGETLLAVSRRQVAISIVRIWTTSFTTWLAAHSALDNTQQKMASCLRGKRAASISYSLPLTAWN